MKRVALGFLLCLTPMAQAQYTLVWQDEFDGASIDPNNWEHMIGDGSNYGVPGWGNNEWEYYTNSPTNSFVDGDFLHIVATKQGDNYYSARLRSLNKADFLYGRIEARIKVAAGQGIWPAFWMLPTNSPYGGWAASGEIDIMESINFADQVHGTLHFGDSWPGNASTGGSYSIGQSFGNDFHVYRLDWEPDVMRWYVDDVLFSTKTNNDWWSAAAPSNPRAPFDTHFHMLLNVAVGGNWPGYPDASTPFPNEMVVDYVRVYEISTSPPPTVTITAPVDGATLPVGDIVIEATASDIDGTVTHVEFYNGSNYLGSDSTEPYSFTWTSVTDGCYAVLAKAYDDVGFSDTDTVNITVGEGCDGQPPYHGAPAPIPGIVQAEDYDLGGEGVAYHDDSTGNNGNQYRDDDVDIENCSEGGYNIGWMGEGEWIEYSVDIQQAGPYRIDARVASESSGGSFRLLFDGASVGANFSFGATGGWQNWTTESVEVDLSPGRAIMRFENLGAQGEEFNFNRLDFTYIGPECPGDLTTTGAGEGDPGYGVPDGEVTGADIQYYVNFWVAGDLAIADLTTTGAGEGDPGYGVPDGQVTGADIQFYVNAWVPGCP